MTRVKCVSRIHHRTMLRMVDGPVVYLANALDSRPRGDKVPHGSSPTKSLPSFSLSRPFLYPHSLFFPTALKKPNGKTSAFSRELVFLQQVSLWTTFRRRKLRSSSRIGYTPNLPERTYFSGHSLKSAASEFNQNMYSRYQRMPTNFCLSSVMPFKTYFN